MLLSHQARYLSIYSIVDSARFQALTKEIRCVVCQNQNIADSNAPLANDLRKKIYQMILDNKSNEEIKNFLVKRYGEYILLQPRFNKITIVLWMFPLVGLILIFFILLRFFKRQHTAIHRSC
ncbi:MAG: cytochrome c-type biogenesis protein CcmH [Gammaproteobacteria bacterium]|nr:cytochrome c-type biogenesis protein CcmH [Gammaproteobacteria bacterium]